MYGKELSLEVSEGQIHSLALVGMLHFSTGPLAVIGVGLHGHQGAEVTSRVAKGQGGLPTEAGFP